MRAPSITIVAASRGIRPVFTAQSAPALPFSTSFPNTENPVSLDGLLLNGGTDGLDWQDMRATPGKCFATGFSADFDDPICCIKPGVYDFSGNHYIEGVIGRQAGYAPDDNHELELHLCCNITANSIVTVETLINTQGGGQMVAWNGPVNDITSQSPSGPGFTTPADGDVIRVTKIGNTFTVKQNSTTAYTLTLSGRSGQPGWAAFVRNFPDGDAVLANFWWKSITVVAL